MYFVAYSVFHILITDNTWLLCTHCPLYALTFLRWMDLYATCVPTVLVRLLHAKMNVVRVWVWLGWA